LLPESFFRFEAGVKAAQILYNYGKIRWGTFLKAGNFPDNHSIIEILNGVFKEVQRIM